MPGLFPDWRARAACRDADPEIFFPAGDPADPFDDRNLDALDYCAACPVRIECLREALVRIPYGIAGGMTAPQRAQYRAYVARRTAARTASAPTGPAGPDPDDCSRAGVRARGVVLLRAGAPWGKIAEQVDVSLRTVERWAVREGISRPPVRRSPHPLSASEARRMGGSAPRRPTNLARRIAS